MPIQTATTELLGLRHPIMLAGMGRVSNPAMAAAVSNAGGLGVIGGVGYTPTQLRTLLKELKSLLDSPGLPFGVDLLLPAVGGTARATNYDYTKGTLPELIDIIVEEKAKVFVSAVGVPPKWVVEKLHANGILYMNMIGHPKHVHKACAVGADLICAQGGEGGGHTGETPTSVLIPACADIVKNYTSPLTKTSVQLVAAGGIADGRGLAAMLMLGASAVWMGTRFVHAAESGASEDAKRAMVRAGFDDTIKSTIWTGRPLRNLRTRYIERWENERAEELKALNKRGVVALEQELDKLAKEGKLTEEIEDQSASRPAGVVVALVDTAGEKAGDIVRKIAGEAEQLLQGAGRYVGSKARL